MKSVTLYLCVLVCATSFAAAQEGSEILIEDFANPTHSWNAKNDPVMGGKSTSSVTVKDGRGIFDGECVDVPFLHAPGFITMETKGGSWPDLSTCEGIRLSLLSTEDYEGYRVSFGNVHVPGGRFAYGYKADFVAPINDLGIVNIPFTDFTAKWDDATGNAIVSCHDDPQYCPTADSLRNLQEFVFWGEGVAGKVHLEIDSIAGYGCYDEVTSLPPLDDTTNPRTSSTRSGRTFFCVGVIGATMIISTIYYRSRKHSQYASVEGAPIDVA